MRDIKFRAKTATTNSWVYGHYAYVNGYHVMYEGVINPVIIKHNTLSQDTNLKDINKRNIHEGDIVQGVNRLYERVISVEVSYLRGCFMFGNYNAHEFFNRHQYIEVIGNIYDNPELLESDI